jgi:hypothetical protein
MDGVAYDRPALALSHQPTKSGLAGGRGPAGQVLAFPERSFDLASVRKWMQELCADRGRPSIDQVVFFKLQLVMLLEGGRLERKLVEKAGLNLAHRWYLRYSLSRAEPGGAA